MHFNVFFAKIPVTEPVNDGLIIVSKCDILSLHDLNSFRGPCCFHGILTFGHFIVVSSLFVLLDCQRLYIAAYTLDISKSDYHLIVLKVQDLPSCLHCRLLCEAEFYVLATTISSGKAQAHCGLHIVFSWMS